ncbi:hypothetical protein JM93_02780 [Roseibium hamelinense]|uniref:Uncharacterized protein n=1 Tax=Roseibium hamelinense TaxID=150831 RepID=A0A562SY56_9HYPH|nr:hypothetical protein [Roseibium hamelinense]MTI44741.1 hypothetical protein [Roseibium hamelinense]TWI86073.1 hypothetical protein JM93_02780 [Roseibium hamelinense]
MTAVRVFPLLVILSLAPALTGFEANAQFIGTAPPELGQSVELPETLTPADVDSLLARLTDAQIRDLLRSELARRA